ncbi:hypothetical protein QUA92_05810 [Microcoleus sp. F8-C1]
MLGSKGCICSSSLWQLSFFFLPYPSIDRFNLIPGRSPDRSTLQILIFVNFFVQKDADRVQLSKGGTRAPTLQNFCKK